MSQLTPDPQGRRDDGFTLPELLITITILGLIIFGLSGTVIRFLQDSADAQGRFSESHDVQFAAAYWERDVGSIGVRSSTYSDDGADVHTYPLLQSVNISPTCPMPSLPGTVVVVGTLAWSEANSLTSNSTPTLITVTYLASGSGPYKLTRVRCTGSAVKSTIAIATRLKTAPVMACSGPTGPTDCKGTGANVPTLITLTLTAEDTTKRHPGSFSATLTGERRQT